jgi:ElaB/YqjD/DUF883 family membrane-anchored ribosome-binding protein
MSQNRTSTDFTGTSQTAASSGIGEQTKTQSEGSSMGSPTSSTGSAAGTATALAQEYGTKITEAASQAKDFVSDKMTVVGDKIKELQSADLAEITENAKDYARKNPGQAILISAAAGLLVGLILRGRR